jgi:hypothetical protein
MTNYILVKLFLDLGQVRLPKGKLVRKPKSILSVFQKHTVSFNPKQCTSQSKHWPQEYAGIWKFTTVKSPAY